MLSGLRTNGIVLYLYTYKRNRYAVYTVESFIKIDEKRIKLWSKLRTLAHDDPESVNIFGKEDPERKLASFLSNKLSRGFSMHNGRNQANMQIPLQLPYRNQMSFFIYWKRSQIHTQGLHWKAPQRDRQGRWFYSVQSKDKDNFISGYLSYYSQEVGLQRRFYD